MPDFRPRRRQGASPRKSKGKGTKTLAQLAARMKRREATIDKKSAAAGAVVEERLDALHDED